MKQTLLSQANRIHFLAILLALTLSFANANAQLTSDEINAAVLKQGSLPLEWTNDADNPWILYDGCLYSSSVDVAPFSSTITATFTITETKCLIFESYQGHRDISYGSTSITIDGIEHDISWNYKWKASKYEFEPGTHTIEFRCTFQKSGQRENWARIRNICLYDENEKGSKIEDTSFMSESSLPIEWINDIANPWEVSENGYLYCESGNSSKISAEITVDKVSLLSYESYPYSSGSIRIYLDNEIYDEDKWYYNGGWDSGDMLLYPGTHLIEFEHNVTSPDYDSETRIRNLCLSELQWYDITVTNPGQVASALVEAIGDKTLQDVALLKINGPINDTDWGTIRKLSGLIALDLSDSNITAIPDGAFSGLTSLHAMTLPKTLITIGQNAFKSNKIHEIVIPASVESIGDYAFEDTPLTKIAFEENSKLKTIGDGAFSRSWIEEFIMPDSVVEMMTRVFWGCSSLRTVKLSKSISSIPELAFCEAGLTSIEIPEGVKEIGSKAFEDSMLESITLPTTLTTIGGSAFSSTKLKNIVLPETLTTIGNSAFSYTKLENLVLPEALTTIGRGAFYGSSLKSVNLTESVTTIGDMAFGETQIESIVIPKNVSSLGSGIFKRCSQLKEANLKCQGFKLDDTFNGCEVLNTVIFQVATPIAIASDPFPSIDKNSVTVLVPEFALSSFKADPYWFQFKNLKSSADISNADYWAINGHLRLYSGATFPGNPSIEVAGTGVLEIVADTHVTLNDFIYNVQEDSPACFLNESNQVSANSLVSKFVVPRSGRWYFFSPVTDVQMTDVSYPATDSWVIRYYDGTRRAAQNSSTGNWVNVPSDGTLKRGQGYIIQAATPGVLIMPAATAEHTAFFGVDEAPMTLDENFCESAENAGWNLVGNPYPAYYDIYSMSLEAPITVWDGSTYRAYSLSDDELVLRPMQPFFVQKTADVTAFAMPRSGRQGTTEIYHPSALRVKGANANRHRINLEIVRGENESADDYTRIVLNEDASMAYEGRYDASKFMSMDAEVAQIYSIGENCHPLAINERPYADGNAPLGVYLPTAGETYRIAAMSADSKIWLYDAENGIEHDLTAGDYTFEASRKGADNTRFSIRFAAGGTTAADSVSADAVKVAGNNGILSVYAPAGADIAFYAADGSVIAVAKVENGKTEIPVAAGVYVVNVNGQTFKTIVK